jgi:hypothetical protein
MNSVSVLTIDTGVVVSGRTYDLRDTLKTMGATWMPETRTWIFRGESDAGIIRNRIQAILDTNAAAAKAARKAELAAAKAKKAWEALPEQKSARVAAARTGGCHWICCDECDVLDWGRQFTNCKAHAVYGNSFRVRGSIWTGD